LESPALAEMAMFGLERNEASLVGLAMATVGGSLV
jgi:hypothetical protein